MKIECPHCGQQLNAPSSSAGRNAQCKYCSGRFTVPMPVAVPVAIQQQLLETPQSVGKVHVITEKTSKRYKLMKALGVLAVIACSVVLMVAGSAERSHPSDTNPIAGFACIGIFLGFVVFTFGRILAWWHHG